MTTNKESIGRAALTRQIREQALEAVTNSLAKFNADDFAQKIVRDLDAQRSLVTWKLLGLDDKWGKWEIDHCNGRTSPVTQYLTEASAEIVRGWVNDAVQSVLAENEAKMKAAFRKAVQHEIEERQFGYEGRDIVRTEVNRRVEAIVKEVTNELFEEIVTP